MDSYRSVVEIQLAEFATRPDRVALVHRGDRLTYGELLDRVRRMAQALVRRGLAPGDGVVLIGGNRPDIVIARLAANLIGCGFTQFYEGTSARVKANFMAGAGTTALLIDPEFIAIADEVLAEYVPPHVLSLGQGPGVNLLELAAAQPAETPDQRARPQDVQQVRLTGGTGGEPKGACYTFDSGLRMVMESSKHGQSTPDIRQLVCTPIAHAAGTIAEFVLLAGGLVVLHDGFDAGEVLRTVERERITDMWLLPPLLYEVLDDPHCPQADLSSLRRIIYGGCAAFPARLAEAAKRFPAVLTQIYGQTETGLISSLLPEEHDPQRPDLLRTAGRLNPGVELSVRTADGAELAAGTAGELWARTPVMMSGYWNRPDLTAAAVRDGWVRTGDVGFLDSEGYLHLVDREKDLIPLGGGGFVCTVDVENVLAEHPAVRQVAVFGVPSADGAERVRAVCVADPGRVAVEELRAVVANSLGESHVPGQVSFVERLPLTAAGKPDKKLLRSEHVAV